MPRRIALDVAPLRAAPAFRRFWAGQAFAYVGWRMLPVAISVQVYRLTGSPLEVGLVSITQFVPLVTLTLLGGVYADALDRRRLLVWSNAGIALSAAGFVANAAVGHASVGAVFALSLVSWSAYAVGAGASRSVVARLVPVEQLPAAAALTGLYNNLGSVLGPALAGVLVAQAGFAATYAVALGGALVALATIARLPPLPPIEEAQGIACDAARGSCARSAGRPAARAPRVTLDSLVGGFRYLRTQRIVLAFFLIDSVAMVFGMPMSLFPALAQHTFGDPGAVGYLFAAPAVGAVAASLLSGWAQHARRQGVAIVVAVFVWGAAISAFGLVRALWLGLLLLAAAGAADQISAIFRTTIVLTVTPDHLRGRLGGIEFAQVASTPALGNLEAGAVASLTSLRFSVVSGGIACVAATLLLVLAFPELRRYDAWRSTKARTAAHASAEASAKSS